MPIESLATIKILGSALIFIFGCIGSSLPVLAHHGSKRSVKVTHYLGFVQQLMLALGAGVVLATAFVHILPEGVESLADGGLGGEEHDDDDCDVHSDGSQLYNPNSVLLEHHAERLSSPFAFSANQTSPAPSMIVSGAVRARRTPLAKLMRAFNARRRVTSRPAPSSGGDASPLLDEATLAAVAAMINAKDGAKGWSSDSLKALIMGAAGQEGGAAHSMLAVGNESDPTGDDGNSTDDDDDGGDHDEHSHSHEGEPYPYAYLFVLIGVAVTFVVESELHRLAGKTQGATMKVHLVEAGIAVHSVLVGIAFGTLNDSSTGQTLMIALVFHQLCEGFAIGPLIYKGSHSTLHSIVLIAIFGGATPVGVGIGAIIDAYSDPNSPTAKLTQGIMMLIASGLLVYVGCVEFLGGLQHDHDVEHQAHEAEHDHAHKAIRRRERRLVEAATKAIVAAGGDPSELLAGINDAKKGITPSYEGAVLGSEAGESLAKCTTRQSFMETWAAGSSVGRANNGAPATSEESRLLANGNKSAGVNEDSDADEAETQRQLAEMKQDYLSQNPKIARLSTYVMFYIGAALMSVIALWV